MRFWLLLLAALPLAAASIANGQSYIAPYAKSYKSALPATDCDGLLIIPAPYRAKPGIYELEIDGKKEILKIRKKRYPKERLRVDPKKVKPPKSAQKRIAAEYKEAAKIYANRTKECYLKKPFILPLDSAITSRYGNARIFNGTLSSYHSGTDFKAAVGTPVRAANDGVVVLAKMRYYAGGSVIIDHGRGIYSCYYHLSGFKVRPGERVRRGEIIGLSGQSGRVTGPHLHYTIKVLGNSVDPLQFTEAFNEALRSKEIGRLFEGVAPQGGAD